jgi:hypothetical protein
MTDPLKLQIVFEQITNLDLYFLYITCVGLELWCMFVSFNFAMQDSNFVVVFWLVTGNSLIHECRCHESSSEVKPCKKLWLIFYFSMTLLMMTVSFSNWSVQEKILFSNGNLTLALAGWCLRLWAGSGCGGSGRAPGWCGWAVTSLLWCCCGGAVCWQPAISLLAQSVVVGEVG